MSSAENATTVTSDEHVEYGGAKKKKAPAKKSPAKKSPAKKSPTKKSPTKKSPTKKKSTSTKKKSSSTKKKSSSTTKKSSSTKKKSSSSTKKKSSSSTKKKSSSTKKPLTSYQLYIQKKYEGKQRMMKNASRMAVMKKLRQEWKGDVKLQNRYTKKLNELREKPKRPTGAFFRFENKIKKENSKMEDSKIRKKAESEWKKMSAANKKPYEDAYARALVKYKAEMKAFIKRYGSRGTKIKRVSSKTNGYQLFAKDRRKSLKASMSSQSKYKNMTPIKFNAKLMVKINKEWNTLKLQNPKKVKEYQLQAKRINAKK